MLLKSNKLSKLSKIIQHRYLKFLNKNDLELILEHLNSKALKFNDRYFLREKVRFHLIERSKDKNKASCYGKCDSNELIKLKALYGGTDIQSYIITHQLGILKKIIPLYAEEIAHWFNVRGIAFMDFKEFIYSIFPMKSKNTSIIRDQLKQFISQSKVWNVRFRLTGVPPDQARKRILLDPERPFEDIKLLIQTTYKINPVLRIQFIFNGKAIPYNQKLRDIDFNYNKDVIIVMASCGG